jgi:hypothetical protein
MAVNTRFKHVRVSEQCEVGGGGKSKGHLKKKMKPDLKKA